MGGKKNFGNQVAKILGRNFFKKKSGNGFTEMEGKKKFVAMELPKIGERERERENCLDKKIILNSYSKKYIYSYFFHSFFFYQSCLVCVYVIFFHFVL